MLSVALMYKDVFVRAQQCEPQYKCLSDELDWQLATIMMEHLKSFYELTEFFSEYFDMNNFGNQSTSYELLSKHTEISTHLRKESSFRHWRVKGKKKLLK
ncbi:hypothetical protein ACOSQ4_030690 [Xanthoceras sorbifolium]